MAKSGAASLSPTKDASPVSMMSTGSRGDEGRMEDFAKCELCRKMLDYPKTLSCLHSYCRRCLDTYISETVGKSSASAGNNIICPICLQATQPPKGTKSVSEMADALPMNDFVRSYLEALSLKDPNRRCDPCRRQSRRTAATQWCSTCHDALCDNCVDFHNALKTTKRHGMIQLSKIRNQPIQDIIVTPHCEVHDVETVTRYCADHREVVCDKCIVGAHKNCKDVSTLADATRANKPEFDVTNVTLGDETKFAKTVYDDRSKADRTLDDKQAAVLQRIQTVRRKINENLVKCENQIIGELYEIHGKEKSTIQTDIKESQRIRKATKKVHGLSECTAKYGKDSHLLTNMQDAAEQSEHYKGKLMALNGRIKNTDIEFVVDDTLDRLMTGIQQLGELKITSSPAILSTPNTLRPLPPKAKADSDPEDEPNLRSQRSLKFDTASMKSFKSSKTSLSLRSMRMRAPRVDIRPRLVQAFSVRSGSDTEMCWVTGIVHMADGQIIIVDRNNYKLKMINKRYKVAHEKRLVNQPFGITVVSSDKIAVTVPRENKIEIYKVGTTFTHAETLRLADRGYGISYALDKFAVACACASTPSIKTVTRKGEERKDLCPKEDYFPMFLRPWYVKMDPSGSTMYIADCHTSQVTSISGAVMKRYVYQDESLNSPRGIYVTRDSRLLVCGFGTDNVQLLNANGENIGDVLTRADRIMGPQDVALDPSESQMTVSFDPSSGKGDILHVYSVRL